MDWKLIQFAAHYVWMTLELHLHNSPPLYFSCAFSTDCGKQLLSIYGTCRSISNLCHCNCAVF